MIIVVGNTKGGVGKTTIAVNLAIMRAIRGKDVWLIDADSQGTAQSAMSIRSELKQSPGISCSTYTDGQILRAQVQQQFSKFEELLIDVGGRDSSALRAALVLADILLVPFHPRSYDVWALNDISSLIKEARSVRDGLKAFAVLNCADPGINPVDNMEAAAAVKEIQELEYLPTPICRRKAFANAAGAGLSVLEFKPKNELAIKEITNLESHLF